MSIEDIRSRELDRLYDMDEFHPNLSKYSRNLNLEVIKGNIPTVYNRDRIIDSVSKILLRKSKGNVLLTGAAGCGKTAIAEGMAQRFVKNRLDFLEATDTWNHTEIEQPIFCSTVIYELSLNSLISGSKYRGDFEERIEKILREIRNKKDIVLFIDEIHQIGKIGDSEGSTGMAQILKPALSRGDIRIIGATTTEERSFIYSDKALKRRFSEVVVPQLVGNVAIDLLGKIMADYSKFHGVTVDGIDTVKLYEKINCALPGTTFPDNAIDIIDETMAGAKFDGKVKIGWAEFNSTFSRVSDNIVAI